MNLVTNVVRVVALFATGLLAGVFFADWLGIVPMLETLSASDYVRIEQDLIHHYDPAMPIEGITALLACLALFALTWKERRGPAFPFIAAGVALMVLSTVVTVAMGVPSNQAILALHADAVSPDWAAIRAHAGAVNGARALLTVLSFLALVIGICRPVGPGREGDAR